MFGKGRAKQGGGRERRRRAEGGEGEKGDDRLAMDVETAITEDKWSVASVRAVCVVQRPG